MNALSQRNMLPACAAARLIAAGFALTLGACAHDGLDDVKPTATTAYHAGQPATPQPSQPSQGTPAPLPQPRQ